MNIKGLKTKDIMLMNPESLDSLSRSDLAKLTSRLASTANKRVKRLKEAGFEVKVKSYGQVKFSTKGKNIKQLKKEFQRASEFLGRKTTKVREYRKWQKEIGKLTEGMTEEQTEMFWDLYRSLYHENSIYDKFKYSVFEYLRKEVINDDFDGTVNKEELLDNIIDRAVENAKELDDLLEPVEDVLSFRK